jgi:hypothetical protein
MKKTTISSLKTTNRLIIITSIIVIATLSVFIGYQSFSIAPIEENNDYELGYEAGFIEGNSTGFTIGFSAGNESGFEAGFEAGFEIGNITGYELSESEGFSLEELAIILEGNTTNYILGYSAGFNEGFDLGLLSGYYTYWNDTYVIMISNNMVYDYPLYFPGNWKGSGMQAGYYVVEFKLNYQIVDYISYDTFGYLHSNGLPSRTSISTTSSNLTFTYNLPVTIWLYSINAVITTTNGNDVILDIEIADFDQNENHLPFENYPQYTTSNYGLNQINIFFNTTTTFNGVYVEDIIYNNYEVIPLYEVE